MGRYLDLAKAIKTAELCGKWAFPAQSAALGLKSEEEQVSPLGSTKFDSDRECEISELCEIIPAAGVAACPPGGHAVLLQVPDGVPAEWVPEDGRPRELFLTAGKEGSLINAMLADAAVVISVALQHGISAQSLAKSVGRLPDGQVTPADLDQGKPARIPASPIGAALDLLRSLEHAPE
jgi:hypothetical protein